MTAARPVAGLTLLAVALLAAALSADEKAAPAAGRKVHLRYKFKPGESIRWEVVHRATIATTIQGTTQTAKTKSESIKVWQITAATPGGPVEFVHLVESVNMANEISGRAKVEYDSQKDAQPPAGYEDVAKAVGVPLTVVRIDAQGHVLERQEKHVQPGGGDDTPIAIPLPEVPVSVGHVWTEPHEVTVALPGGKSRRISTRRRFELKGVQQGRAEIAVDYQVLTPLSDPALEAQLIQRLHRGQVTFDLETGRVVGQQMNVDRRVLGFSGPASSMHYLMQFSERLLAPGERVAKKSSTAK